MQLIEAKKISLKREGQEILKDISFVINKGDYIGLIGPNGAGKTTLLKILLGFINPTAGAVKKKKKTVIGYVPQDYTLSQVVPVSVSEVLSMSGQSDSGVIKESLQKVGMSESVLKQNFHKLSGGQKQRVIIARALCLCPDILVFDEPLNGIDYETKIKLYDLLSHLNETERLTILFVSHEVDHIIGKCHHILCLNQTMHTGCHPLDFAKGKTSCDTEGTSLKVLPVHHHHDNKSCPC